MRLLTGKKILLLLSGIILILSPLQAQISFPFNSTWSILKGSQAENLPSNWYTAEFDDSYWTMETTPVWYGDGLGGTELTDMRYNYSTVYFRTHFTVTNPGLISTLYLRVNYDDGFIVWINGKKAHSQNAPALPSYNAFAPENHESGEAETFLIDAEEVSLLEGENLIAVQGFNISLESSDFHMNLSMEAESEMPELPFFPDSLDVEFSHQSGYYSNPFTLTITSLSDTVDLYYTLDGRHPGTSPFANKINGTATVPINPGSTNGRATTPAVVVRTSFRKEGYKPSPPQSRTFIFINSVKTQVYPGGDWPNYNVNSQIMDYAMDTEITLGEEYGSLMENSLLDLPAISLITDNNNLFGPAEGIYVNAEGHGFEWERECSVEMIYPDSVAFQTNAGLRIRGGWSRHPDFPKHSFRLFFRSLYGDAKLDYPLFGDEGTDKYDKIDLRTSQNYAWAQGDPRNTMVREVFSRDLQRDMGQPYTRSRYYHLYINGMYWGVYQTQERSEARYASSYFGDSPDDYDVVKVNTENYQYRIEATDGNLDLWKEVYDMSQTGFGSMQNYYLLQGRDQNGKTNKYLHKLVDIDNLIDYMISIFYAGNFDAPTSSFGNNNGCNNFYAINERDNPTTGFVFFNHDAEHSLFYEPASPGIGIQEDRVNLATRTDNMRMTISGFERFHPQWLHYKLTSNPEYCIRFNDRAHKYLKPGGILTKVESQRRMRIRVEELYDGIIAESGRWGDTRTSFSYTRDDYWLPEITQIKDLFFALRPGIFEKQLLEGGLYTTVRSPVFEINNIRVLDDIVSISSPVSVHVDNTEGSGELYYTVNGYDPRLTGGGIAGYALQAGSDVNIEVSNTSVIRARVYTNEGWSAISVLFIMKEVEDYSELKVTEIHYHPLDSIAGIDTLSGSDFEFIELKNTGESSINLTGLRIDSAIRYNFPDNKILLPGGFFVLASKPVKFFNRYGMIASGNYEGNLANEGEVILIEDSAKNEILRFGYANAYSWPVEAGGLGYSLVPTMTNPELFPGFPEYWKHSAKIGGSPFANDGNSEINNLQEIFSHSLKVYPNPASHFLTIEISEAQPDTKLEIGFFDFTGKLVYQSSAYAGESIDLTPAGLKTGMYILEVSGEEFSERCKIIIVED